MRARYYDPQTGRFISRDPVDGELSLPQTHNPYTYSVNDPINLSDPSGLWTVGLCGTANFGVGAFGTCTGCIAYTEQQGFGATFSLGGGGTTGVASGIGVVGMYSDASNFKELEGIDIFGGGSGQLVGGDTSFSSADPNLKTYTVGVVPGPDLSLPLLPYEFHGGATKTWTASFK